MSIYYDNVKPGERTAIIVQREVIQISYTVNVPKGLKTKKDILEWFEDSYDYVDRYQSHVKDFQPKVESITKYDLCPHYGQGWTNLPLPEHGGPEPKSSGWHYNERCDGTKETTDDVCPDCALALSKNYRQLTHAERVYLSRFTEWSHIRDEVSA